MLAGQSDSFIALAEPTLSVFSAFSPLPQVQQSCACVKIGDMCVVSHVCGVHGNTILCCHSQVRSRLSLAITSRQLINSVLSALTGHNIYTEQCIIQTFKQYTTYRACYAVRCSGILWSILRKK